MSKGICLFEPIYGRCPDCDECCEKCSYWYVEHEEGGKQGATD